MISSISDDTEMVLSGKWLLCEDTLRDNIWLTLRHVQVQKDVLIYIDPNKFKPEEVHVMTVDTVKFKIEEPHTDKHNCGKKWYDQKSASAGVKYEFALPLTLQRMSHKCDFIVFVRMIFSTSTFLANLHVVEWTLSSWR
jgi:hypothetical protein